jgi:hypothetical protein
MITNGYTPPVDANSVKLERSVISDQQKKDNTNQYKARTILLNSISYNEYEKITNRDSAKAIFNSSRMTHEGNELVKETKALALIQKYESFKMDEDENT